jgi:hypothetical protein
LHLHIIWQIATPILDLLALQDADSIGLNPVPPAVLGFREDGIGTGYELFPRLTFRQSGYSEADSYSLGAGRDMNSRNLSPQPLSNRNAIAARRSWKH